MPRHFLFRTGELKGSAVPGEFEAGHNYDFRSAALVRQLREHRTMLRRYVTAHAAAAQAGTRLPAATQALLEAYYDARALLGEPSPKTWRSPPLAE